MVPEQLSNFDIIISSTASQLPILGKGAVEAAINNRKHRPMFLVDLAVPRDIEKQVSEISDVFLYTVDDLRNIADHNVRLRELEVDKASEIIKGYFRVSIFAVEVKCKRSGCVLSFKCEES